MKDDFPDYDEWYSDFLNCLRAKGYSGPVDKEGCRGYYEADDLFPDEAAIQFITNTIEPETP